jgi:hypothetical protein
MEYELEEEGELLDESNNPSLDHSTKPSARRETRAPRDRSPQKAMLIPEEATKA